MSFSGAKRLIFRLGADIQFRRHHRLDVCVSLNHNIALYVATTSFLFSRLTAYPLTRVFLPASDIPSFVGKGNVDLGITGHDVILEANMQDFIVEEQRLGFGKCSLQVQVPEAGPIKSVDDLAGKRVVTSFEVLAKGYFDEIDARLGLQGEAKTKIEYVGGSVEAACALGLADGIGASFSSQASTRADELRAQQSILSVSVYKLSLGVI